MQIPFSMLYEKVQEILKSKVEEFHYFGYDSITEKDVWRYCIDKVWRKQNIQNLRLHELTSGIFSVRASQVVNYLQVNSMKKDSIDNMLSKEELDELFHPK